MHNYNFYTCKSDTDYYKLSLDGRQKRYTEPVDNPSVDGEIQL